MRVPPVNYPQRLFDPTSAQFKSTCCPRCAYLSLLELRLLPERIRSGTARSHRRHLRVHGRRITYTIGWAAGYFHVLTEALPRLLRAARGVSRGDGPAPEPHRADGRVPPGAEAFGFERVEWMPEEKHLKGGTALVLPTNPRICPGPTTSRHVRR